MKHILSCLKSLWLCGPQQTLENSEKILEKRWEYQTTWPASWEICMQVRKQWLELYMEQQTGSKSGKEVHQGCILSSCLFNLYAEYIMRNVELWSTSWNQDCQEKYQKPQISRWQHPYSRNQRRTKKLPDESERREWKSWLKTQHSEN